MKKLEDPCEKCFVNDGTTVFDGQWLCRKCAKKLKKGKD